MVRRILAAGTLAVALTVVGAIPAHASETRVFRGEGSSSFGPDFAYYYALGHALRQAQGNGFESADCHVVDSDDYWPVVAYVYLECTGP
ncbi:hypothetical protein O7627_06585 [Solwaraspora sp. WMMD1047]|uniref:hypothetical protein n=1 Tax=Solwaraspora sp. WMMD1047 TaxID=3016102 RepID=UPI002416B066|nr:hypothetical protein [Solwaraspora sp. WMMD1047]MDG4828974.1 hypothetical protein [Solwaraspora sp. WMMD1047]